MQKKQLGNLLIENKIIDNAQLGLFNYGLTVAKLLFANLIAAILISLFLDTFFYCILFLIIFPPLRRYSGGFHAGSPIVCFVESQVLVASAQLFAIKLPYFFKYQYEGILILTVICAIIIFIKSPVYSRYKPLTPAQEKRYGKLAKALAIFYIILNCIFYFTNCIPIFLLMSIALIYQSILLFIPEREHTKH